ncbi:hypothetical protein EMCRGX_G019769 [Ephydatia muelleri]
MEIGKVLLFTPKSFPCGCICGRCLGRSSSHYRVKGSMGYLLILTPSILQVFQCHWSGELYVLDEVTCDRDEHTCTRKDFAQAACLGAVVYERNCLVAAFVLCAV